MLTFTGLTCICDEDPAHKQTFENVNGSDTWRLKLRALKTGWYLPHSGKQLCPKCHSELAHRAGLKSLYDSPYPHAAQLQAEITRLQDIPAPPEEG